MLTEESAYKVLNNILSDGSSVAGIPIIISAYNEHKDNAGVVENMCTLFMELSEYSKFYSLYVLLYYYYYYYYLRSAVSLQCRSYSVCFHGLN